MRQQTENNLSHIMTSCGKPLHVKRDEFSVPELRRPGEKQRKISRSGRKELRIHMLRANMNNGVQHCGKMLFLTFGTNKIKIALRDLGLLNVHKSIQLFRSRLVLCPCNAQIGNNKSFGKGVPEKKSRTIRKRNKYHVGNEPRLPNMKEGTAGLLRKPHRLVPFFRIGIHARCAAVSIYFKPGVNDSRTSFILSRIKRKKHDLIVRIRGQQ